jgi:hypothetical protein
MAKCRGCNKEVIFIQLKSGKFNPVDPELYSIQDILVEPSLIVVSKTGEVGKLSNLTEGYISHFATCLNAKDFRKKVF